MKCIIKHIALGCVTAAVFFSCQDEHFADIRDEDNFYADVEAFDTGVRTSLGEDRSVVWSSEDRIVVFEGTDKGSVYQVLKADVGSPSGEFTLVGNLSIEGSGAEIEGTVAVYPFNEDLNVSSDGNGGFVIEGVNFPTEQTYTAGSFQNMSFPMAAVSMSGGRNLAFKNIGGVLKLSIKGDYAVSTITIKGNSGELISGPATINLGPDGIPVAIMDDDASRSVTLVCNPAVQLDAENAEEFYISVPVTDFEAGFTVAVTDSEGNTYRKKTTLANPVMRSTIHVMPSTDLSEDISDEATENYIDLGIGRTARITSFDEAAGSISLEYSSSTIPVIEAGKAFVMPVDQGGSIRVIDSHVVSDNTVTLQTTEGNMCNLFKNTSFTLSTSPVPDTKSSGEWDVITPSAYGYIDEEGVYHEVFNRMTKANDPPEFTSGMVLWSFHENFNGEELISGNAGSLAWEKCEFDAALKGVFNFDFGEKNITQVWSIGDIKHFKYEIKGSYNVDMLLKYEYGAEYEEEKDEFLNIRIPSGMFTFVVGTVPVHLRVDTRIGKATEFSVEGSVSASAGINLGSEISIGAEFTPENGLQPVNSIKNNNTLHTPELEISASASAKVSYYPHIDIKFYNLIGPWFEARPYLSEDISAGMTLSADGSRDLGWKSLTSAGLDLHMGLFVKFLNASLNFPLEPMNLFDATIFEAPKKITRISPAQGTTIRKGQMIDATFKAESYSPLTKKYYPCPGALIYFDTKDGTYSPKASIANVSGLATTRWTPKPNTVTKATTEHNLTASIIDHDGEAIDETTLTVSFEEAEQWVDLGLSVLWAGWNLGADSPEEYGGYYAWGETTEKNSFTWENYRYAEQFWCVEYGEEGKEYRWPEWIGTFIGSNISGTAYDAAHVQWGDGARMPTYGEIIELMLSCDFNYGTYNGVEGNYVTGPNGNSIFLPFAGDYFVDSDGRGSYNMGSFWSGTYDDGNRNRAIGFTCDDKGNIQDYFSFRGSGQSIRPVRNLDGSDKPADEGPEVDGYDPEDNPFYEYGDNGGGESGGEGGGGSGYEDPEGLWVDLGLSVKWAAWNVGASSPEEPGGYYAWGETEEKPTYTWDNYIFTDPDTFVFDFIGEEISGTMYDVAHVKWGNGARMPTRAEMQELIDNCTFELVEAYNDIPGARGLQITGPNGNRIFLPNGGLFMDNLLYVEEQVNIWSGTFSDLVHDGALENSYAYSLFYDSFAQPWERERYRLEGLNVRPVKD